MVRLLDEIIVFLKREDNFLITCHMKADGDAYASVLYVAYLLEKWQKKYRIILHDEHIEKKYDFLWGFNKIESFSKARNTAFQAAVVLDVPSLKRIGEPAKLLPERDYCVKIDHHPIEDDFARYALVSNQASSTSQLVYEIVEQSDVELDNELAKLLFTGILYDTGRFSFSNTSRRDFEIAANLLKYDVKPYQIANRIFFNNSFQAMKTIGYGLANMQSYLNEKVAVIYLPLEVMQSNNHSEIEELANYSVAMKNVEVGLFIREVKPGYFKISFRSKGNVDVNKIAKAFGGGGHRHAAGSRLTGNYQELIAALIQEISQQLKTKN